VQLGSVANDSWRDEKRTDWCELVETLAEAPLGNTAGLLGVSLPSSSGDIVGGDVACYVRESIFLGNVLARFANHNALDFDVSQFQKKVKYNAYKLSLIVYCAILGDLGNGNILVEASNRGRGLDEQ
jgi:hypothetical protein